MPSDVVHRSEFGIQPRYLLSTATPFIPRHPPATPRKMPLRITVNDDVDTTRRPDSAEFTPLPFFQMLITRVRRAESREQRTDSQWMRGPRHWIVLLIR
jgi:hypothetical protein